MSKLKYTLRSNLNLNFLRLKKSLVSKRLCSGPQRKGFVTKVVIITPKKPNSALRHVAKVGLYKSGRKVFARIPGIGSLPNKYNRVLVRGGRANDLPTVRLTVIRGVFDFSGLLLKKKRRSIYGAPRPESKVKHIRRRFRHLY